MIRELDTSVSIEQAFLRFAREPQCQFLDSSMQAHGLGRFSYLLIAPRKELRFVDGVATIIEEGQEQRTEGDPFDLLEKELGVNHSRASAALPFCGGAVGYLSYDLGRYIEDIPSLAAKEEGAWELRFVFHDAGLAYDHQRDKWYAFAHESACDPETRINGLRAMLQESHASVAAESFAIGDLKPNFTKHGYMLAVEEIREMIARGDVYQVNMSQRVEASLAGSAAALYTKLRSISPAAYAAYLNFGDEQILSSSPERLLQLCGRAAVTRPIKGTRPRGRNNTEDMAMRAALSASDKDRAELLMIVDLERNDLGRVCETNSIEVDEMYCIEEYANVFHQTASVRGKLRPDIGFADCLRAIFPGGSITGAPKIQAMRVIEQLEPMRRGVYTGAIGYVGYDGNMEFNVAIRTLRCAQGLVSFNVGGGIVWDSDPETEYEETLHKAQGILQALGAALD